MFEKILSVFGIGNQAQVNQELRDDLEKFIEESYGKINLTPITETKPLTKPYTHNKPRIESPAKPKVEPKEKQLLPDMRFSARMPDEDANSSKEASSPKPDVRNSREVRYSLPPIEDREELSAQADKYFISRATPNYSAFRPEKTFKEVLLQHIIASGLDNVEIYKRANLSKSVFSSIMTNSVAIPKKGTVVALAIALKLDLEQTERLLMKAGYTFSNSIKGDLAAVYFINHKIYDIDKLNIVLHDMGEPLLGSKLR